MARETLAQKLARLLALQTLARERLAREKEGKESSQGSNPYRVEEEDQDRIL